MSNLNTPADFLEQVKASEALAYIGAKPSPEFLAIHREQEKEFELEGLNPEKWLDDYFGEMLKLVNNAFPPSIQTEITQRIAVGCVDNADVNAFIIRSDDGQCFAILVNRALITMVNNYVKLIAAAGHPSSVIHCNGLPVEKLTRADYTKMSTQMLTK